MPSKNGILSAAIIFKGSTFVYEGVWVFKISFSSTTLFLIQSTYRLNTKFTVSFSSVSVNDLDINCSESISNASTPKTAKLVGSTFFGPDFNAEVFKGNCYVVFELGCWTFNSGWFQF